MAGKTLRFWNAPGGVWNSVETGKKMQPCNVESRCKNYFAIIQLFFISSVSTEVSYTQVENLHKNRWMEMHLP